MHKLGLLPFVKTLQICSGYQDFSPKHFNRRILHQFSALTNVQALQIHNLDIPSFIPRIRRYFSPFLPSVRTLSLRSPRGSNRQLIFFVGFFQHLENLSLFTHRGGRGEPEEDPTLIPTFAPPLRGRLEVWDWTKPGFFRDMVHLFGEIRFGVMNLLNVDETRFLLRSCGQTLRALQLHPTDRRGKPLLIVFETFLRFQPNNFVAGSSLLDFDLSGNKSLETLTIPVDSVDNALRDGSLDTASRLYKYVLSTIRSPVFSWVQVCYQGCDFRAVGPRYRYPMPRLRQLSQDEEAEEALQHFRRFELLREVHKVRDFQLVLCALVWESRKEFVVRLLKEAVAAEKARGGFDDFFPQPRVAFRLRSFL
jgi:hypothetical protein